MRTRMAVARCCCPQRELNQNCFACSRTDPKLTPPLINLRVEGWRVQAQRGNPAEEIAPQVFVLHQCAQISEREPCPLAANERSQVEDQFEPFDDCFYGIRVADSTNCVNLRPWRIRLSRGRFDNPNTNLTVDIESVLPQDFFDALAFSYVRSTFVLERQTTCLNVNEVYGQQWLNLWEHQDVRRVHRQDRFPWEAIPRPHWPDLNPRPNICIASDAVGFEFRPYTIRYFINIPDDNA